MGVGAWTEFDFHDSFTSSGFLNHNNRQLVQVPFRMGMDVEQKRSSADDGKQKLPAEGKISRGLYQEKPIKLVVFILVLIFKGKLDPFCRDLAGH
jgi:hypothetical protein